MSFRAAMKHLTGTERLLIVAFVMLVLLGSIVRYYRAQRDAPDSPPTVEAPSNET